MAFRVPEARRVRSGPMASEPHAGAYGAFLVDSPEPGWELAIICDDGTNGDVPESLGWEHVSVRAFRGKQSRIPSWKEMAFIKDLCWDDEDLVVQYHPRKSEYVNAHPYVLHLWCSRLQPIPSPAPLLVGPRPNQRFSVIAERDTHGGDGWTLFDLAEQRVTGGWFADRIAAERTAETLNASS